MKKLLLALIILGTVSCSKSTSSSSNDGDSYISINCPDLGNVKISGGYNGDSKSGVGILMNGSIGYEFRGIQLDKVVNGEQYYNEQWWLPITTSTTLEVKTYEPSTGDKSTYNNIEVSSSNFVIKITSISNNKCSGTFNGSFSKLSSTSYDPHPFTGEFKNVEIVN